MFRPQCPFILYSSLFVSHYNWISSTTDELRPYFFELPCQIVDFGSPLFVPFCVRPHEHIPSYILLVELLCFYLRLYILTHVVVPVVDFMKKKFSCISVL